MAKKTIDYKEVVKAYPALKDIVLNDADDFNNIASVIGSRNPNYVWPIRNALARGETTRALDPKLTRLFG